MSLLNTIKESNLHMEYLNSINEDWFIPFNTQSFNGYKGCYKLAQELFEAGFLEKRKLRNGRVQFKKIII